MGEEKIKLDKNNWECPNCGDLRSGLDSICVCGYGKSEEHVSTSPSLLSILIPCIVIAFILLPIIIGDDISQNQNKQSCNIVYLKNLAIDETKSREYGYDHYVCSIKEVDYISSSGTNLTGYEIIVKYENSYGNANARVDIKPNCSVDKVYEIFPTSSDYCS